MNTYLSAVLAMRVNVSPIWMPVTFVAIGLNSPRISFGASVLMSHMSWWGGPPPRKMLISALCRVRGRSSCFAAASARRMSASVSVAAPKLKGPARGEFRRGMPSQKRVRPSGILSIAEDPGGMGGVGRWALVNSATVSATVEITVAESGSAEGDVASIRPRLNQRGELTRFGRCEKEYPGKGLEASAK